MYSVSRKNCENNAAANKSPVTFEPDKVRKRKMPSGSNGARDRSSITRKPTISAADAASSTIVLPLPHPCVVAQVSE